MNEPFPMDDATKGKMDKVFNAMNEFSFDFDMRLTLLLSVIIADFHLRTINWRLDKRTELAQSMISMVSEGLGVGTGEMAKEIEEAREIFDNELNVLRVKK